jgi:hypothetical protein
MRRSSPNFAHMCSLTPGVPLQGRIWQRSRSLRSTVKFTKITRSALNFAHMCSLTPGVPLRGWIWQRSRLLRSDSQKWPALHQNLSHLRQMPWVLNCLYLKYVKKMCYNDVVAKGDIVRSMCIQVDSFCSLVDLACGWSGGTCTNSRTYREMSSRPWWLWLLKWWPMVSWVVTSSDVVEILGTIPWRHHTMWHHHHGTSPTDKTDSVTSWRRDNKMD